MRECVTVVEKVPMSISFVKVEQSQQNSPLSNQLIILSSSFDVLSADFTATNPLTANILASRSGKRADGIAAAFR